MKLVFATRNQGKIKEMKLLLKGFDVVTAEEVGVFEEVQEDGKTFEENALKKARFVNVKTGFWSIGEDTGICIDALDGKPGVYTARWAGEGVVGEELVNYTLEKMKDVPVGKRGAYFETVVALVSPEGKEYIFSGKIEGDLTKEFKGKIRPKLPYDLIFIPKGETRTFSEMSDEEKNSISHRGKAIRKLIKHLDKLK